MNKVFNPESPLMSGLSRALDLMILNILWVVCSLPIITFGAATTAVYYVTFRLNEGKDEHIIRSFFKSFASNFRQSTIIWLILLAAGVVIAGDIRLAFFTDLMGSLRYVMMAFSVLLAVVWLAVLSWVFVLQSRFENPVKQTLKNACLLAILNIPTTVLSVAAIAASVWVTLSVLDSILIWMFIGYALIAYFLTKRYRSLLVRFENQGETPDQN